MAGSACSHQSKALETFLGIYIQVYECPLLKENAMNCISRSLLAISASEDPCNKHRPPSQVDIWKVCAGENKQSPSSCLIVRRRL